MIDDNDNIYKCTYLLKWAKIYILFLIELCMCTIVFVFIRTSFKYFEEF